MVDENYREPLEAASKATGGRLLRASGRLVDQLVEVIDDLDSYYSLGFQAPADWAAGSRHDRIKRYELALGRTLPNGLLVEATYRATRWNSNVQLIEYERQIFGINVTYVLD